MDCNYTGFGAFVATPHRVYNFEPKEDNIKIKVLLKELDKHNLIFQVLWMDERFRSSRTDHTFFSADNGIKIISGTHPVVNTVTKQCSGATIVTTILLQGINSDYDTRACITCVDNAYREKIRIITALKDWALNWEGFEDPILARKDFAENIYCI